MGQFAPPKIMPACKDCAVFINGNECALNPARVAVSPDHWCSHFRAVSFNAISAAYKKAGEREVYEAFCALPDAGFSIEYKAACQQLVTAMNVSRVTLVDRLNRLVTRNLLEVFRRQDDQKKIIRYIVDPEADKRGEVAPIPYPEDKEVEMKLAPKPHRKWNWPDVVSVMPVNDAISFSDLARLCPKITRGPFARCLREAIGAGRVERTMDGKYRRVGNAT
jgi:DNA-binding HxlR family transcriptional regulator